ncbi:dihydrodipicolinate synthase family protein [Bradyrhizobium sp.]|uniref:dihydrodipicolinate synthase family protein n=1 Tax=Bradyrhizobium sp. TaxID=376 RepID=UPI0025C5566C|nr:dihydrodipicolinate synthase family protein [Bradyrhizobium sp.]MBV8917887.1 dihydrodipicolinate synthase family protein [Bradyrhizobium sp.]
MTDTVSGFWVATATPLTAEGAVDHARLAGHAQNLFKQGVDGVVLFGTTGEGTSFSIAERIETAAALLKSGIGPERIGLGGGFPAITDAVVLARSALGLGLKHVLMLPPYFDRGVIPEGIEDAFAAIIDGIADDRLRVTLYNIPQVSGVAMPASVAANLRRRYGVLVAGVKDSSADFKQFRAYRAAAPELAITVGNETDIARALAEGGAGTICGMANVVPGLVKAMIDDGANAEGRMRSAIDVIADTSSFTAALKAVLAAQTGDAGWLRVRPPLRPLIDGAALKARLDALMSPAIA